MNQTEMLHQMCHSVLSEADVKDICKNRGLPSHAVSSRGLLESVFVSDTGVVAMLGTLDRTEIALLHLLRALGKPVDVAFFSRLSPPKTKRWSYGTFTQRFQVVFSKVKERLVRRGVLILTITRQTLPKKTKMERWRFALPVQFARQLPPLVESVKRLDGEGEWRRDVARDKLRTLVGQGNAVEIGGNKLEIVEGELSFGGQPFRAGRFLEWQKHCWLADTNPTKHRRAECSYLLPPAEAAAHILAGLDDGIWCDADALTAPLETFCGFKTDSRSVAESAKGRLKTILDHLRESAKHPPSSPYSACAYGEDLYELDDLDDLDDDDWDDDDWEDDPIDSDLYYQRLELLPSALPVSNSNKYYEGLRTAVVSAINTLPQETFASLGAFLQWQAHEANPLPALFAEAGAPTIYAGWSHRLATIEEMESLWSQFLMEMLRSRLLPLGGVRLGVIEGSDDIGIALTGPGRYLLGIADDFDYGQDHASQDQIVVQPNFEIVFLAPSPLAEASLARFTERKARGIGSLFSITKKSILAAAGSGMTAAQVIETLTRLSAKAIPANVAREIQGWFDQCRRINVHSAVLIHCPDADTAARVVSAGGKKAVSLTDTVVELTDSRAKTALLRKLHGLGIFTETSSHRRSSL